MLAVMTPPRAVDAAPSDGRESPHEPQVLAGPALPTGGRRSAGVSDPIVSGSAVRAGTRWTTASYVVTQLVRFAAQIVLARVLAPADFGLMAMAMITMQFLDLFRDLGTRAAIVQRPTMDRAFASSIFYLNVALGLVFAAVLVGAAGPIAGAFGNPGLAPLLQLLAVATLLTSWGLVHQALMHRELRFRAAAAVQIVAAGVNGAVAVVLALQGFGVWSLVLGFVAGAFAGTVLAWLVSPWRPARSFSWSHPREVAAYSLNLSGSDVIGFSLSVFERFLMGRLLGAGPLGIWSLAGRIFMYPLEATVNVLHQVLFPTLARIENHRDLGAAYLRAVGVVAVLSLPAMVGLALVAEPLVTGVLGTRWAAAVPIMMILAPIGAVEAIGNTASLIYKVTDRTDWLLRWSIGSGALVAASVAIGVQWGLLGVAVAHAIVSVLLVYPCFAIPFRLIDLPMTALLRVLRPSLAATAAMAAAVEVVRRAVDPLHLPPLALLAVLAGTGAVVYGGIMLVWRPQGLRDLVAVAAPRLARALGPPRSSRAVRQS